MTEVVNLKPDIKTLVAIINNAVEVAYKLGIEIPKVALLAAVETINPDMEETIKAGVISKMNQRGQITGCIIDGPLALDNAISEFAAKKKGLVLLLQVEQISSLFPILQPEIYLEKLLPIMRIIK